MTAMRFTAFLLLLCGFVVPSAHAQKTPEDLLEEINRLPIAERQRRLEDGAKKERDVVWYSTMNREDSLGIIRAFESEYPYLKVNFITAGGPRTLNRITAEYRAGSYLYDATGYRATLVRGVPIAKDGTLTGATPGTVLR